MCFRWKQLFAFRMLCGNLVFQAEKIRNFQECYISIQRMLLLLHEGKFYQPRIIYTWKYVLCILEQKLCIVKWILSYVKGSCIRQPRRFQLGKILWEKSYE